MINHEFLSSGCWWPGVLIWWQGGNRTVVFLQPRKLGHSWKLHMEGVWRNIMLNLIQPLSISAAIMILPGNIPILPLFLVVKKRVLPLLNTRHSKLQYILRGTPIWILWKLRMSWLSYQMYILNNHNSIQAVWALILAQDRSRLLAQDMHKLELISPGI